MQENKKIKREIIFGKTKKTVPGLHHEKNFSGSTVMRSLVKSRGQSRSKFQIKSSRREHPDAVGKFLWIQSCTFLKG
jgi:hypothetical protein